eukprot:CAMPEP_0181291392 /NCGR_PEP_ID=MMETSP1101-20121128/1942_1 /TAXON_ID=46948 /ORGANISM="Rhodomonas abbreviata, Strain Caron Lab Isolate" /LENGTH=137 /DNA_ID=CAMNT_0023395779 /DNA_START=414 /DNA_END=824 /DNA_ORIENTATION=+
MESSVIWGSPFEENRQELLAQNPGVQTFSSKQGIMSTYALWYLGVLPFVPLQWAKTGNFFSVVHPTATMQQHFRSSLAKPEHGMVRHIAADIATRLICWLLVSPALHAYLEARGVRVILWVLNSAQDWEPTAGKGHR